MNIKYVSVIYEESKYAYSLMKSFEEYSLNGIYGRLCVDISYSLSYKNINTSMENFIKLISKSEKSAVIISFIESLNYVTFFNLIRKYTDKELLIITTDGFSFEWHKIQNSISPEMFKGITVVNIGTLVHNHPYKKEDDLIWKSIQNHMDYLKKEKIKFSEKKWENTYIPVCTLPLIHIAASLIIEEMHQTKLKNTCVKINKNNKVCLNCDKKYVNMDIAISHLSVIKDKKLEYTLLAKLVTENDHKSLIWYKENFFEKLLKILLYRKAKFFTGNTNTSDKYAGYKLNQKNVEIYHIYECSRRCELNEYPKYTGSQCCFNCFLLRDNEIFIDGKTFSCDLDHWPNILRDKCILKEEIWIDIERLFSAQVLSFLLSIIILIIFTFICIVVKKRKHRLYQETQFVWHITMLICLFVYTISLSFYLRKPNNYICPAITASYFLPISIILGICITKSIRGMRISRELGKNHFDKSVLKTRNDFVFVIFFFTFQLISLFVAYSLEYDYKNDVKMVKLSNDRYVYLSCRNYPSLILSYRQRKISLNFFESYWISRTFACLLIKVALFSILIILLPNYINNFLIIGKIIFIFIIIIFLYIPPFYAVLWIHDSGIVYLNNNTSLCIGNDKTISQSNKNLYEIKDQETKSESIPDLPSIQLPESKIEKLTSLKNLLMRIDKNQSSQM
ncbi:hypothetical protein A3Q56_06168 [Intoshia linei]|uniref:G-protein coupled receptors family 3 profile domain-containing protein n=1 Tax=Intoshia linei TaxID=1819745 RepID=A0A177AY29_9BILA|nr:hypothetical protein A3Q56_06168 [Intoshia linei]